MLSFAACILALAGCGYVAAPAQDEHLYPVSVDSRWGFIDQTGAIRIEPQFLEVRDFSGGLAAVAVGKDPGAKWGFIDASGSMVIPPEYDIIGPFSEGLAAVLILASCWGFIDKTGKMVIPPQYDLVGPFSEGLAPVGMFLPGQPDGTACSGYARRGYIDRTGGLVIPV